MVEYARGNKLIIHDPSYIKVRPPVIFTNQFRCKLTYRRVIIYNHLSFLSPIMRPANISLFWSGAEL